MQLGRQVGDINLSTVPAEGKCALNGILELPNVAWPIVGHHQAQSFLGHCYFTWWDLTGGEGLDEVVDEKRDVLTSVSKGRQEDWNDVEPVI